MALNEPDESQHSAFVSAAGRLGQGAAITWLAWVAARALALATLILLTQALSSEDLGALLAALAAGLLGATLATGGLPDATTRTAVFEAERGFGRGDVNRALVRFALACPAILVLIFAIVSRKSGALDWSLLTASVLLAITQGGTSIAASIFRARGQAGRYALVTNLLTSIGRTVVGVIALTAGLGAGIIMWAFVAINAGVIVGTWSAAVSALPPTTSSAPGEASLHLGGAVWSLLQNLDVVVVGLVVGASGAGTYGAALRLAEFTLLLLIAMTVLYLPEAAKLAADERQHALVLFFRASSRWCALVALLVGGTGWVVAPDIAQLLLPEHASTATTVLRILLPAYALHGALGLAYSTSVALGDYRTIGRTALVAIPTLILVTVGLTELWDITGAATATAIGYTALTIWWLVQAGRALGALPFDALFVRAIATCVGSWISAGAVAYLSRSQPPFATLVAAAGAASITWLAGLWILGALSPPERRALARLGLRSPRVSRA